MKKVLLVLLILTAFGFEFSACGSEPDPCDKMENIRLAAYDQACGNQGNACCFCRCWNDGHLEMNYDPVSKSCACTEPTKGIPIECIDEHLNTAKACLADPAACKESYQDDILNVEIGFCTTSPLG